MKKLMSIASALLCGTVLAALDTSAASLTSGVVGYGQAAINLDYTGVGPMFFAIGEDVTSIQNLQLKGVSEAEGTGYTIAPITSTGNIPVKYFWWCGYASEGIPDGWYITDDADIIIAAIESSALDTVRANITMAKGEGLVTQVMKANLVVHGSGEVLSGNFTRPINLDYTGVANPFPANVGIQSYAIVGVSEAEGTGYTIAPITSTGNIPVKYFWWCGYASEGIPDGWYITDDADIIIAAIESSALDTVRAAYTFAPGEAAVTQVMKSGLQLSITSPID